MTVRVVTTRCPRCHGAGEHLNRMTGKGVVHCSRCTYGYITKYYGADPPPSTLLGAKTPLS